MSIHKEAHYKAGQTVLLREEFSGEAGVEFVVEDWWDRVGGKSWQICTGNIACLQYAARVGVNRLPFDDEVVYGHIGGSGELIHACELVIS